MTEILKNKIPTESKVADFRTSNSKTKVFLTPNQVYRGDCLELMEDIPDKSIDMINCDLPYGTTACKWDTVIPFEPLWEQYKRVIKDNGAIVLTAAQPFTTDLINSNREWFKYEWVWNKIVKRGFLNCKKRPLTSHENIIIFYQKQPIYNPIYENIKIPKMREIKRKRKKGVYGEVNKTYNVGIGYPSSIITIRGMFNYSEEWGLHPTQKPVALFEYLINTYTNEGDLVLDNCAGSMTTAIACINTHRDYYCIEKEKEYYDKGVNRIKEHTRQLRLAL